MLTKRLLSKLLKSSNKLQQRPLLRKVLKSSNELQQILWRAGTKWKKRSQRLMLSKKATLILMTLKLKAIQTSMLTLPLLEWPRRVLSGL